MVCRTNPSNCNRATFLSAQSSRMPVVTAVKAPVSSLQKQFKMSTAKHSCLLSLTRRLRNCGRSFRMTAARDHCNAVLAGAAKVTTDKLREREREYGLTSHQRHYRSYRGRVFTGQMTNQQCQSTEGLAATRAECRRSCGQRYTQVRPWLVATLTY